MNDFFRHSTCIFTLSKKLGERKERLDLLLELLSMGLQQRCMLLQRCKMMKMMMMMVKKMYLKMCSRPFFTLLLAAKQGLSVLALDRVYES